MIVPTSQMRKASGAHACQLPAPGHTEGSLSLPDMPSSRIFEHQQPLPGNSGSHPNRKDFHAAGQGVCTVSQAWPGLPLMLPLLSPPHGLMMPTSPGNPKAGCGQTY